MDLCKFCKVKIFVRGRLQESFCCIKLEILYEHLYLYNSNLQETGHVDPYIGSTNNLELRLLMLQV